MQLRGSSLGCFRSGCGWAVAVAETTPNNKKPLMLHAHKKGTVETIDVSTTREDVLVIVSKMARLLEEGEQCYFLPSTYNGRLVCNVPLMGNPSSLSRDRDLLSSCFAIVLLFVPLSRVSLLQCSGSLCSECYLYRFLSR